MENEKINVLIVEDEAIVALDLASGLENDGYKIAGIADNAGDALNIFRESSPDIVLMDINIKGDRDGIDTTEELLKIRQVPVIYLTAFSDNETVSRVKKIQPAAFLSKPYSIDNVRIAIELAISNLAVANRERSKVVSLHGNSEHVTDFHPEKEPVLQMGDYIFVKHNYHFIKIKFEDLLFIETENNYIKLCTREKKILLRMSLTGFLEKIDFHGLVRVHRSFAVNIGSITSFNDQLIFIEKIEVPMGRNYREDFLRRFHFR